MLCVIFRVITSNSYVHLHPAFLCFFLPEPNDPVKINERRVRDSRERISWSRDQSCWGAYCDSLRPLTIARYSAYFVFRASQQNIITISPLLRVRSKKSQRKSTRSMFPSSSWLTMPRNRLQCEEEVEPHLESLRHSSLALSNKLNEIEMYGKTHFLAYVLSMVEVSVAFLSPPTTMLLDLSDFFSRKTSITLILATRTPENMESPSLPLERLLQVYVESEWAVKV